MNKRAFRLVLSIIILSYSIVILSGCNASTVTQKPTNSTNENAQLSKQELDLVGYWYAMYFVAAGYAERYSFDKDRSYRYLPSEMVNSSSTIGTIGKWSIKENELILIQEKTIEGVLLDKPIKKVIDIGSIENADENIAYKFKVKIGDKYFWKFSDNPHFDEITIPKSNTSNSQSEKDSDGIDNDNVIQEKITPEEAMRLILKFRDYELEELNLDGINEKTGEYYITRNPGASHGTAGVAYRVNPITGDVFNDLTNELEFNLFEETQSSKLIMKFFVNYDMDDYYPIMKLTDETVTYSFYNYHKDTGELIEWYETVLFSDMLRVKDGIRLYLIKMYLSDGPKDTEIELSDDFIDQLENNPEFRKKVGALLGKPFSKKLENNTITPKDID